MPIDLLVLRLPPQISFQPLPVQPLVSTSPFIEPFMSVQLHSTPVNKFHPIHTTGLRYTSTSQPFHDQFNKRDYWLINNNNKKSIIQEDNSIIFDTPSTAFVQRSHPLPAVLLPLDSIFSERSPSEEEFHSSSSSSSSSSTPFTGVSGCFSVHCCVGYSRARGVRNIAYRF